MQILKTSSIYLYKQTERKEKWEKWEKWGGNLIFCFHNVQETDERERTFTDAGRMDAFALQLQLIPAAWTQETLAGDVSIHFDG